MHKRQSFPCLHMEKLSFPSIEIGAHPFPALHVTIRISPNPTSIHSAEGRGLVGCGGIGGGGLYVMYTVTFTYSLCAHIHYMQNTCTPSNPPPPGSASVRLPPQTSSAQSFFYKEEEEVVYIHVYREHFKTFNIYT